MDTLSFVFELQAGDSNIYHSDPAKVQEIYEKLKAAIAADGLPYKVYLQKVCVFTKIFAFVWPLLYNRNLHPQQFNVRSNGSDIRDSEKTMAHISNSLVQDVPSSWHYVNAARTGDIVIEPLPGGQVKMKCARWSINRIFFPF